MSVFQSVLDQEVVEFDQKLRLDFAGIIRQSQYTLCVAETFTGGLLSQFFSVEVPEQFKGGITVYRPMNIITLCGVLPKTIRRFGMASEEVSNEMAVGIRRHFDASLSISVGAILPDNRASAAHQTLSGTVFTGFVWGEHRVCQSLKVSGAREMGQKMVLQSVLMFLKQRLVA